MIRKQRKSKCNPISMTRIDNVNSTKKCWKYTKAVNYAKEIKQAEMTFKEVFDKWDICWYIAILFFDVLFILENNYYETFVLTYVWFIMYIHILIQRDLLNNRYKEGFNDGLEACKQDGVDI